MNPGLAKIIQKLYFSRYFESSETVLHKAAEGCGIDDADTELSMGVHWLPKTHSTSRINIDIGFWM